MGSQAEPRSQPMDHPPPEPDSLSLGADAASAPDRTYGGRFTFTGQSLRQVAARGVIVNSVFQVGLVGLSLIRNVAVAAFLTAAEFGLWALVITTLMTLVWLRQVGIGDKYLQQDEPDQVLAFQKAFTLELAYTLIFYALVIVILPAYALIYDRSEILLPSLLLSVSLIAGALQTPIWIAWRQMRFVRQRLLESVEPVVSTILVIALAAAGAGYWSLVIGILAGSVAGAVVALITNPYPLRLRYERGTMREYASFSWPLLASSASALVAVQGTVIIGNYTVGLAGIGAIGLAGQIARFADQVDAIISRTIYPAICAVKDRLDLLHETFVKSNRLAVMWGLPVGVGITLFAPGIVDVLGTTWEPAEPLIQAFGLIFGIRQIGFNWMLFFSARGDTRPVAVEGIAVLVVFAGVTAPLLFVLGLDGFVIGSAATVAAQLAVRAIYLSRLFENFSFLFHLARSVAPTAIAASAILAERAVLRGDGTGEGAIPEFVAYVALATAATVLLERRLLGEMLGYLRGGPPAAPTGDRPATPSVAA
jgi:O-antigen/teichoic acid export membrane protein